MDGKKTALVLSGGGAKGAFQMMAEKYAREQKGYHWDIIAGVSVGAVNGMMLAMEKYTRLEQLWWNITREQVMTGKLNFWTMLKIAFGAKSVYSNDPLWQIIQREYEPDKIKTDFRIGTVSIYVAPLGLRLPGYRQMDLFIAENDLKATAIYYTDLEEFTRAERSIRDGMRFAPAARTSGGPSVHP